MSRVAVEGWQHPLAGLCSIASPHLWSGHFQTSFRESQCAQGIVVLGMFIR